MAAMVAASRSANSGARCMARHSRSLAGSAAPRTAAGAVVASSSRPSSTAHAPERPADRLVGPRPNHLPPLVAGGEEPFLHVGLELPAELGAEVAALVQPGVGPH